MAGVEKRPKRYCPKCKKKVAVVKHGKPNKQRFKCSICGNSFVERMYNIEVKVLAVKFYEYSYSLRKIAKIFSVNSPNTIRNWSKIKWKYDLPYQKRLDELKNYKQLLENKNESEKYLSELNEELPKVKDFYKKKEEKEELEKKQASLRQGYYLYNVFKNQYEQQIEDIHKEMVKIKVTRPVKSLDEIQKLIDTKKDMLSEQNQKINYIKKICVFTNKNFDIVAIIDFLEKLTTE